MSKYHVTVDHSPDGEFCRIRSVDENGNEGAVILESKDLASLIAMLAQTATNIQKKKGSQNIPYFPANALEAHEEPGKDHVLVTFRIDPDLAMTFGLGKQTLKERLSDLAQFLEDGSGGTTSKKKH